MKHISFFAAAVAAIVISLSASAQETVKVVPQWPSVGESLLFHVTKSETASNGEDVEESGPETVDMRLTVVNLTPDGGVIFKKTYENLPAAAQITDAIRNDSSALGNVISEELKSFVAHLDGTLQFDANGDLVSSSAEPGIKEKLMDRVMEMCGTRTDVAGVIYPLYDKMFSAETFDSVVAGDVEPLFKFFGAELTIGTPMQYESEESFSVPLGGAQAMTIKSVNTVMAHLTSDDILVQVKSVPVPGESERLTGIILEMLVNMIAPQMGVQTGDTEKINELMSTVKDYIGKIEINSSTSMTYLFDKNTFMPKSCGSKANVKLDLGTQGTVRSLTTTQYTLD